MDYGRENRFSRNTFQVISGARGSGDLWDIDYDGRVWKRDASVDMNPNSRYNGRETQTREPPNKESKSCQFDDMTTSNRSTGIGKMLFKTKLCCKFRAGSCPYINNCNFAHSIEELRKPPPNWQEIVSAREEGRRQSSEPREEFQIPSLGSSDFGGESQRSYKGRHCKRFYSDEGCPYGDACTFLHDEQSKARESVAISLGPGSSGGYGGSGNESNLKPSNWKTRICNKWEETGYCPFGSKCYFAHGAADLLHYTGGMIDNEAKDSSAHLDSKHRVLPSKTADVKAAPVPSIHHSEGGYLIGAQPQKLNVIQKTGSRPHPKWKGPDKISKIYGDWLDDIE